ncbi:PAS domain-containing protein [Chryseolinea sp. T2]|uniref:PAS domain-containing protein n=1 Tax=Chryseolinea sp. T2 TaxID=3129255 RepID=UPI00307861AE
MKRRKLFFTLIFRVAYLLVLVVFFLGIYSMIQWQQHYKVRGAFFSSLQSSAQSDASNGLRLVSYSEDNVNEPSTGSSYFKASSLNFSEGTFAEYFSWFAAVCSISFLLIYMGWPIYNVLAIHRPIGVLSEALISEKPGDDDRFMDRDLHELKDKLNELIKSRNVAIGLIDQIGKGNYTMEIAGDARDKLYESLKSLHTRLQSVTEKDRQASIIHSNSQQLERILKEESDWNALSSKVISFLSKSLEAGVGQLYVRDETSSHDGFQLLASYGSFQNRWANEKQSNAGQLGELLTERRTIVMENLPAQYLVINSGLGSASATHVVLSPLLFKGDVYGAVEFGFFRRPEALEIGWIERSCESMAAHFFNHKTNSDSRARLGELASKQAAELVEIRRLQEQTLHELEIKLREVEEERQKNESVLEGCVDGVLVFSSTGEINFCNRAATDMLGIPNGDVLRQSVTAILPIVVRESNGQWKTFLRSSECEKEIEVRTEATFTSGNGEVIDVLITCTQSRLHAGIVFTLFMQKISVDLF